MQMKTDAQLLREYAGSGSETAFGELVSRHADLVYSAALRQVGELHRLRAEVARLRREREELAKQSVVNSSNPISNSKPPSDTNHLNAPSGYEQYLRQVMETGTLDQQARSAWSMVDAISHGFGLSPVQIDFLAALKTRLEGDTLSTDDFATFQTALLSSAINLQDDSTKQQVEEMLLDAFREVAAKGLKPGSPEQREINQRAVASVRRLFSGEQLQAFNARIESVLEFKLVDWALAMGEIMKQQRATKAATGESIR